LIEKGNSFPILGVEIVAQREGTRILYFEWGGGRYLRPGTGVGSRPASAPRKEKGVHNFFPEKRSGTEDNLERAFAIIQAPRKRKRKGSTFH